MKRLTAFLRLLTLSATTSALLLSGCSSSEDKGPDIGPVDLTSGNGNPGGATPVTPIQPTEALFQPAQGILPYPTDLHFLGSTDGTLNMVANALVPNQAALNALDGFSTTTPIRVRFGGPIDPASLTPASVFVVRLTLDNATKAPIPPSQGGVVQPLVFGTDFVAGLATDAGVGNTILEIRPTRPLVPSSGTTNVGYLVVLTNGITTASGQATTPDTDYAAFKAAQPTCDAIPANVRPLCQLTGAHLALAQAIGVDPANVTISFSFTTQSTRDTMAVLANPAVTTPQPITVTNTGATTATLQPGAPGTANVYTGTLRIPYYLSRPTQANPTAPLTAFWLGEPSPLDPNSRFLTRFNPRPVATELIEIPILVTVPNAGSFGGGAKPANGWPVLIFQHGLTRSRRDALLVADTFANAAAPPLSGSSGYVVVAIDLPLHGITDTSDPLYDGPRERTFNLNLVNNANLSPPADDVIDGSGTHFVNLTSPLTSRDNLRQGAADLLTLVRSLPNMDLDGDGTGDIDPTRIHFLGHSLGGIVGTVFLGVASDTEVRTGVIAMSGGSVAQTIIDSPAFGPAIKQALAAQGVIEGTTLFAQFIRDIQTVVDAGDPINYIQAADAAHPLLLYQVVGGADLPDGTQSPPDQVVVNSSTQRLISAIDLPRISTPGPNAASRGFVNFILGEHGSLIDPRANADVTAEMQREAVRFSNTLGTTIHIFNPAVIEP
ncbi:MAG TPA: alpha/beta fold hydrolase [Steroidobacteraceae bacterium]